MRTQNTFAINAKTCTLKHNKQESKSVIFDENTKYIVPIYQRPYSWGENEIRRFISDIFISFCGNDGVYVEDMEYEPMFIGTMQLTAKNGSCIQEIIDGQQRLSTLLVLIKVLSIIFPDNEEIVGLELNRLSTKVNSGEQQEYLDEFIKSDLSYDSKTLNPYLRNAYLVKEYLSEHIKDVEDDISSFKIDKFMIHLLGNIYFVVIETNAGLSKTLQIFDAINTSGLDLDGGDLFKIRMYEYLTRKNPDDDKAFEKISELYKKIDEYNKSFKRVVTDIRGILSIYQYILVARYKLPVVLYNYGVDRFYEELFDALLGVQLHENFINAQVRNVELFLEEIEKIIEIQYYWEERWVSREEFTLEDVSAFNLIFESRYRRYWRLPFVVQFMYGNKGNDWKNMLYFMRQLNKLFFIYSVRYQRAISEINYSFMHGLISSIVNKSFSDTMDLLNDRIGNRQFHKSGAHNLDTLLTENLTENDRRKKLICLLSAMLDESAMLEKENKETDVELIKKISKALFESNIDIEHIQSLNDQDEEKRKAVSEEWCEEINSLGNLMILERDINRSIGNSDYSRKIDPEKEKSYVKSRFQIVKKQIVNYPDVWNKENSEKRAESELKKILQYLFEQPINI